MGDEKVKGEHLNVNVKSNDNEVLFKIKFTTPLGKLMSSYCERQGKSLGSVRFLFDGKRVDAANTPKDLDMEDGDIIEATVEQQGGGELQPEVTGEQEAQSTSETHLNIKVSSGDQEVHFKIKKTTPMAKVFDAFCSRQGKSKDSVRFMLDGTRVNESQTPNDLDMEDGDTIQAVVSQIGGGELPASEDQHINLKVAHADSEMVFKIKKSTPLLKLMNAFCERQGKDRATVKFKYDGNAVTDDATPTSLEMEDGDVIDAFISQTGGHC